MATKPLLHCKLASFPVLYCTASNNSCGGGLGMRLSARHSTNSCSNKGCIVNTAEAFATGIKIKKSWHTLNFYQPQLPQMHKLLGHNTRLCMVYTAYITTVMRRKGRANTTRGSWTKWRPFTRPFLPCGPCWGLARERAHLSKLTGVIVVLADCDLCGLKLTTAWDSLVRDFSLRIPAGWQTIH